MKPVKIFTFSSLRPDLIKLQYASLKTFVEDEFEFIIFNNAVDSKKRRAEIDNICKDLGLNSIHVKENESLRFSNNRENYVLDGNQMRYPDASSAFAYAMNWSWSMLCDIKDSIISIIDSDMFFINKVNFNDLTTSHQFLFVPQYRGVRQGECEADVFYPWTGFFIIDMTKIINPEEMRWDCGVINGHQVDPGGMNHYYLKKYQNKINIKFFEFQTINLIQNLERGYKMHCCINGCSNLYATFTEPDKISDIEVTEPKNCELKFFPHEKSHKNYIQYKAKKCLQLYEKYLLNSQSYPQPSCIDFLEVYDENYSEQVNPLIFHYKGGSNYSDHPLVYNQKKTAFLVQLLKKVSNGRISESEAIGNISNKVDYARPSFVKRVLAKFSKIIRH